MNGTRKDDTESNTSAKKTLLSLLFSINLLRYCVENSSEVFCKIKVDIVNTMATEPPITEPIESARLLRASAEIVKPILFKRCPPRKAIVASNT